MAATGAEAATAQIRGPARNGDNRRRFLAGAADLRPCPQRRRSAQISGGSSDGADPDPRPLSQAAGGTEADDAGRSRRTAQKRRRRRSGSAALATCRAQQADGAKADGGRPRRRQRREMGRPAAMGGRTAMPRRRLRMRDGRLEGWPRWADDAKKNGSGPGLDVNPNPNLLLPCH
jgi:hypothetical protein